MIAALETGLERKAAIVCLQEPYIGIRSPLRAHAARWLLASGMMDSHLLVVSGVK